MTLQPNSPAASLSANANDAPARFGSGQSVRRLEDDALLVGAGQFTCDVNAGGQASLFFLRSPYPHARIVLIDSTEARAMPGVLQIVTGADLVAAGVKPIPGSTFKRIDRLPCAAPDRRALAHERVRFVGEAVVAVVALTLQQARDAAEAVMIDYDELPMVVNLSDALAPNAPRLSDAAPDNLAGETRYGNAQATADAFAVAAHVVALEVVNQRVSPLSLEPRTVLAVPDAASGRLTLRMSTQMPSGVRNSVCDALGLAKADVRVIVGDVGGGFGMKTGVYPEDIALAFCARALQRPLKWVAERSEEFISASHGRDIETRAEMALDASGKILALRLATLANVGAYATGAGVTIQVMIGPWVQTSVYDIQTIDFHFKAVLTNTTPTGAYRGAGRPEAIFNMERLMDEAARQTGIDRLALRRRNFITPAQMPYTNPMAQTYDSGHFEVIMDQALVLADGMIEVFSAVNGMGQGILTSLAQLVVDAFGVPMSQVRVVLGDTDRGDGFGSAGSRSIFTGGSAMREGAERTIAEAKRLAAQEFEAAEQDIEYRNGRLQVAGTDMATDIFALASRQPDQRIFMQSTTAVSGPSWPNACHISEVEIDPLTGHVQVVAYASVNDIGRVVNPMIVRGQLDGGAVQGIGQALCEHMVYDRETGQPVTGSLMDYAAPRADDSPDFKTELDTSVPCLNNPLGVKGVGELGTIGATPSVVNAVADALSRAGMAAKAPLLQMPLSPARVWTLMHD